MHLWDNKLKKLYLVRDRFGEKPLFYYKTNEYVIFGSELKIINNQSLFNLEISQKASFYYSLLGYIPAPFTIYKNVFKVMPSQIIEIDQFKNFEESKYYSKNIVMMKGVIIHTLKIRLKNFKQFDKKNDDRGR